MRVISLIIFRSSIILGTMVRNVSAVVCNSHHTPASCFFITIMCSISGFIAVIANTILLVSIIPRCKRKYPTILLVNMAVADLLTGVYQMGTAAWTWYGFTWKTDPYWMAMFGYTLAGVTLISVSFMSIDRYFAVRQSLQCRTPKRGLKTYLLVIILIWIYTIVFSTLAQLGILSLFIFIMTYFAPSIIICVVATIVCYTIIYRALRTTTRRLRSLSDASTCRQNHDQRLTKLFASVSGLLLLLTLPQVIVKVLFTLYRDQQMFEIINDVANAISLSNSAVNPFLYWFFSQHRRPNILRKLSRSVFGTGNHEKRKGSISTIGYRNDVFDGRLQGVE